LKTVLNNTTTSTEDKYQLIFNSIGEGFCIYELIYDENDKIVDLRWLEVNPAYEKQTGLVNVLGKLHSEIIPDTENYWLEVFDRVSKTGEAVHFENWHEPTERWYNTFSSRIGGADSKQIAVVFSDITTRRNTEEKQQFLLKLSDALRPLKKSTEIQLTATKALVEHLHIGWCYYFEIDADCDTVSTMEGYSRNAPVQLPQGTRISDFGTPFSVYKEGKTIFYNDIETDKSFTESDRVSFRAVNSRACIAVPLLKDGKLIALLGVSDPVLRKWKKDEILLIEEVAQRTWAAVEIGKAEEALRKSEENLERLVEKRTNELTKLKINQEKERLNAILLGQEQERTRIGEGLHNGVAQLLFAATTNLKLVHPVKEETLAFTSALSILTDAISDIRKISFELMPPILKDHGLEVAIQTFMRKVTTDGINIKLNVVLETRLSERLEISLYRIVQEILNNIIKHSGANKALIELRIAKKYLHLMAEDNGVGFNIKVIKNSHKGIGLQSIENRVTLLDGKMKIRSQQGEGTSIDIRLPI
jgi:PAS domain S-box-containing protein